MAIIYVGKDTQEYKTISAAIQAAKDGDTVVVSGGVYRERVVVDKTISLIGESGAIIDGGWNGEETGSFAPQLAVTGRGARVTGLTIRNCPGRGVLVNADGAVVTGCRIDRTYQGAMLIGDANGPQIGGVTVADCTMTRMSLSWVTERKPTNVNGSLNIHNTVDSVIRGNVLAEGWGEGINIGRGSTVRVENNIVHSTNHVLLYFNRCQNSVATGNILFHIDDGRYAGKQDNYSAGIIIGDEGGPSVAKWPPSSGNVITGNVVVNAGKLFQIRNNKGNYDSQMLDTVIEGNTFVAGPCTERGIDIQANQQGRPHRGSVFRNNVIDFTHARAGGDIASHGQASGIDFGGNVWSAAPPQSMRGAGDFVGDVGLIDAAAEIVRLDLPDATFDIDNYRPLAGSAAVGRGALDVLPDTPPVDPPTDPEPPGEWVALPRIDYDEAMAALRESREAIDAALILLGEDIKEF
jgi:nitrous oxidase accessory protein NosD